MATKLAESSRGVAVDIVIPKLGMTMKQGTIVEWVVPDGAHVDVDDVVFVLSTDKLDTEVTAEVPGTLRHGAAAGECHPCSTVVGWIVTDGAHGAVAPVTPNGTDSAARVIASPLARKIAQQFGVDLTSVTGTGPNGRIVKDDVEAAASRPVEVAPPERTLSTRTSIPIRGMRRVIADRMHSSLREMAQLTIGMEVDVSAAVALREELVAGWHDEGVRVSVTDLVARAAVMAIADHPSLNASIEDDEIILQPSVDLGVAVAVRDGLLVPVVRDADRRSLASLSREVSRLASACRDGSVSVDELDGSTFTITALGAQGVDFFTPVINPPNVAILGIGRRRDGVVWEGERPVRRDVLTLSLTFDHRAIDGVPAAEFLGAVRDRLQSPLRLLA